MDLTAVDDQVDVAERRDARELLGDVAHLENGLGHCILTFSVRGSQTGLRGGARAYPGPALRGYGWISSSV